MAEIELRDVPGWPADLVEKLGRSWISSADQVVAVGVTSGGVKSLSEQMEISERETQRLIALARSALSPAARSAMGQRVDSEERGLGAIEPGKEGDGTASGKR